MSASVADQRRLVAGVLLAAAGAYILFQPFGVSPGGCVGSLSRFVGPAQATTMCVASLAAQFVVGSVVGLIAIVAAVWALIPRALDARIGPVVLAAAILLIIGAGVAAIATSPTGPFRTFAPAATALPVQTSVPTSRP